MRSEKEASDDGYIEDRNYQAYLDKKVELEKNYIDEHVAFVDGSFVGHHQDREQLLIDVYRRHTITERSDVFVTQVGVEPRKVIMPQSVSPFTH